LPKSFIESDDSYLAGKNLNPNIESFKSISVTFNSLFSLVFKHEKYSTWYSQ
jgi:hypothetical protein